MRKETSEQSLGLCGSESMSCCWFSRTVDAGKGVVQFDMLGPSHGSPSPSLAGRDPHEGQVRLLRARTAASMVVLEDVESIAVGLTMYSLRFFQM
eukprot:2687828-Amphidinium_carterae.1